MKKYVFATMLFASMVVSLPSAAQQKGNLIWGCPEGAGSYFYDGKCQTCPLNEVWDGSRCCKKLDPNTGKCPSGEVTGCSKKTEYLAGKECKACPANATCDGVNATCNSGYVNIAKSIHEIICAPSAQTCSKTQYIVNNTCVDCPTYGKCNGNNVKCPGAYTKDSKGFVKCTGPCEANMYLSGGNGITSAECTACPANATCNGTGTVTCKAGYAQSADKTKGISCVLTKCKTNQYLLYGKCMSCPANATCNGQTATCKSGYAQEADKTKGITCVLVKCKSNQYIVGNTCANCPKLGTCDGKNVKCPYGYTKDAKGYVTCKPKGVTCKKNQYIVGNKCVACPKGATCDGENPKCPNGYTKDSKGYVTCKAKLCEKGSHESIAFIKKTYKGCTKCRTEKVAAGKCAKNKKAHQHYYCDCNC